MHKLRAEAKITLSLLRKRKIFFIYFMGKNFKTGQKNILFQN